MTTHATFKHKVYYLYYLLVPEIVPLYDIHSALGFTASHMSLIHLNIKIFKWEMSGQSLSFVHEIFAAVKNKIK